jgi:serine/threonine protein kinase
LKDDKIKIADLGLAKKLEDTIVKSLDKGTEIYRSPEMFKRDKKINIKFNTDIWSSGIVFYELITFELPFTLNDLSKGHALKVPNLDPELPCLFQSLIDKYESFLFYS